MTKLVGHIYEGSTMKNIFTDHPHSIGETYLRHGVEALFIALRMTYTSAAMIIHAFLPFLFVKTARKTVYYFYNRFEKRLSLLNKQAESLKVEPVVSSIEPIVESSEPK